VSRDANIINQLQVVSLIRRPKSSLCCLLIGIPWLKGASTKLLTVPKVTNLHW